MNNKIAILIDPDDKHSPSDALALKKFEHAAIKCGLDPYFITSNDIAEIKRFDALFIRCMTSISHYSLTFIKMAKELKIVSLDDENTVFYGSNKYNYYNYLHEKQMLHFWYGDKNSNFILTPKTLIVDKYINDIDKFFNHDYFPLVVKRDDGFFCESVYKVDNEKNAIDLLKDILKKDNAIIQQYIPTDYDWRIGILNKKPIFVCKYWMAEDHWQIAKHEGDNTIWGDVECIDIKDVPKGVIDLAIESTKIIGDIGLFGVDIKDYNGKYYLIEVNDNPNIEAGFEDKLLGDKIYLDIMQWYADELNKKYAKCNIPKNTNA